MRQSLAAVIGLEFKIFTLLFPKSSNKSFFTNSLLKLLASLLNESVLLSAKGSSSGSINNSSYASRIQVDDLEWIVG